MQRLISNAAEETEGDKAVRIESITLGGFSTAAVGGLVSPLARADRAAGVREAAPMSPTYFQPTDFAVMYSAWAWGNRVSYILVARF